MTTQQIKRKHWLTHLVCIFLNYFVNSDLSVEYWFQTLLPLVPEMRVSLEGIEGLIDKGDYRDALRRIDVVRHKAGEFPELVALQAMVDALMFLEMEVGGD